jgi:tetratricopeptide (TPR) repeat protein
MTEFQQQFNSPSANLELIANLHPLSFADARRRTAVGKASKAGSPSTHSNADSSTHLSFEEVIDHLKRGYQLTPNDADSAFNLVAAYKQLGRWAEATEAGTIALELYAKTDDPNRATKEAATYFLRGYAYASMGVKQEGDEAHRNFEKAESDYLKALELQRDYMMVYCYLGVLYAEQQRWKEAEKALKQAIKLKPRYGGAHHDLGALYLQCERPRLAMKAFEKAVEYEPKNLLSLRHLAETYYDAGRWDDARRILLRVLKLEPKDVEALYKLGGAYLHLRDFQKAEKTLLRTLDLDPDDIVAYNNLCVVYYKAGRLWDAAASLAEALRLEPDNETARATLSDFQMEMIEKVIEAHAEDLESNAELDPEQLIENLAGVREIVSAGDVNLLTAPAMHFPDQLTVAIIPLMEKLEPETRFELAARLFKHRLLSAGKAAQLLGKDRITFLKELEDSEGLSVESDQKSSDLPPIDAGAALALLQSWYEEDPREQRETWKYLKKALDEDRLSDRKLFA